MLGAISSAAVIKACKRQFARHGIPTPLVTDNGPQFASEEFRSFAKDWGFDIPVKSPCNPQSNGKAESAVKIAKNIMRKAKRDKKDLHKAILEWRNTPTDGVNSSPVQRLFNRRTKGILSMAEKLLKPEIPAMNVPEAIQKKNNMQKAILIVIPTNCQS